MIIHRHRFPRVKLNVNLLLLAIKLKFRLVFFLLCSLTIVSTTNLKIYAIPIHSRVSATNLSGLADSLKDKLSSDSFRGAHSKFWQQQLGEKVASAIAVYALEVVEGGSCPGHAFWGRAGAGTSNFLPEVGERVRCYVDKSDSDVDKRVWIDNAEVVKVILPDST